MPIKGLSDRGLSFPEIGTVRKGAKKRVNKNGKEIFGEDLTYFRFEFAEGEVGLEKWVFQKYGEHPNNISVILPFNEIERSWDPWMEAYTAGRLVGRSDGEYIQYLVDTETGEIRVANGLDVKTGQPVKHPADNVAGLDYQKKQVFFKNSGRLKVMLFGSGRAAYFTVLTSSKHDILNISQQLAGYKDLNNGQIAGIPFILRRVPRMISTPNPENKAQRIRRKKYLISVEVDSKWVNSKILELSNIAQPQLPDVEPIAGELPPGALITEFDEDEVIESGEPTPEPREPEFMQDAPAAEEPKAERKLVYPLGAEAVTFAAKEWNVDNNTALKELTKKNLGKAIAWDDLVEIVKPQHEAKPA